MADSRQLEIVQQASSAFPSSLATQFFTSMRRCCPDVAQVRTLDALSTSLADAAEGVAQRALDREFIETAGRSLTVRMAFTTVRNIVCQCAAICESPIELALAFSLSVVGLDLLDAILFDLPAGVSGNTDGDNVLRIKPQCQIDQYRVDFVVTLTAYSEDRESGVLVQQKQLVVECDGADYHDASIEQLVRDRQRDRQLQVRGFHVFRYSGAEIWRDCFGVAREVLLFLKSSVERQITASQRKQMVTEKNGGPQARAASLP